MKNPLILYNTYTRQRGPDDCGLACLSMLLNYAGRYEDAALLLHSEPIQRGGISMYDLRNVATAYQLHSRCVEMDKEFLRALDTPCILHTQAKDRAFHFVICYYAKKSRGSWKYLIGDPATGMAWYSDSELDAIWPDGAALYPEGLHFRRPVLTDHVWSGILNAVSLRNLLFISIPLLNIFVTMLGVALSWLLQRGINDSLSNRKDSLLNAIIILLGLIMLAKSLGNYIKQHLLIRLNGDIRRKFLDLLWRQFSRHLTEEAAVRKGLADVQRIQNAVSALFAVLFSEGSLLMLLVSGMWYFEPLVGLIVSAYITLTMASGTRHSIYLARQQAVLADIASSNEISLEKAVPLFGSDGELPGKQFNEQQNYTRLAETLAAYIGRNSLLYECFGAVTVTAILFLCLYNVRQGHISYNTLITEVITSYFITVLSPRICQVFPVITEGARLARRYEKLN